VGLSRRRFSIADFSHPVLISDQRLDDPVDQTVAKNCCLSGFWRETFSQYVLVNRKGLEKVADFADAGVQTFSHYCENAKSRKFMRLEWKMLIEG
jgi:hypothetical protein